MKLLLIANYSRDQQRSMIRYCSLLRDGLKRRAIDVEIYTPPVVFGRFFNTQKGFGKWVGYIDKYLLASLQLGAKALFRRDFDLVHICDHSNAHYVFFLRGCPHTITCHDLLGVRSALGEFPENPVGPCGRIQQKIILRGLKRSGNLNCVSEATARDLHRLIGFRDSTVVIPNAIHPEILECPDRPIERNQIPYLLHVGSNAWYKNRRAVLTIFKAVADEIPDLLLKIVGPRFSDTDLRETQTVDLSHRIQYSDNLSDDDLGALYAGARILVFPSLIEGFGWPILEAQIRGSAVLTSSSPPMSELNALPELQIAGEPGTESWQRTAAAAVLRWLGDPPGDYRSRLIEHCSNYSIDKIIEAHLENYHSILNSKQ